jgi:glycosyltransferase involved in cell wall biosynthesis
LKTTVLLVSATRPDPAALGGIDVHVAALATSSRRAEVLSAYPSPSGLVVEAWGPRRAVAVVPLLPGESERGGLGHAIAAALHGTCADVLHLHSPGLGARAIARAAAESSCPLVVTLHDHSLVCENYTLLEGNVRYCGIPVELARCDDCLRKTYARPDGAVQDWRSDMRALVEQTRVFVVPSASVLEHAARVHPEVRVRARHIAWGVPDHSTGRIQRRDASRSGLMGARGTSGRDAETPLRIAVVGVFATVKGADRLPELFRACRDLDVEWHLFGATEGASQHGLHATGARVVEHGAYRRSELARRLGNADCRVALLPSIFPESFSLALSEVTAAGLPVLGANLGALGERIAEGGLGWTFDPFDPVRFANLVAELVADRALVDAAAERVCALPIRTESDMASDHEALWASLSIASADSNDGAPHPRDVPPDDELDALYAEGVRNAEAHPESRLERWVRAARQSEFYRDFGLRRVLPESTRHAVDDVIARLASRRRRE